MITLKSHGKDVIEIHEESIDKILNLYPDENLINRRVFLDAKTFGELSYSELRVECDKLLLPWQLFLLDPYKLDAEIDSIIEKRRAKFEEKLIANRNNEGKGVSLRIADRLIALQEYVSSICAEDNVYAGSLKNMHRDKWSSTILEYFDIDINKLSGGKKGATLEYLIEKVESKNIRVARGVLTHKLLPASNEIRATYRKSSGFVVQDRKIPYIFLPSEISDNETPGRQILTLLTLIVLTGLDDYSMSISGDFELVVKQNRTLRQAYGVVNEILLPFSVTKTYKKITPEIVSDLSTKHMLTPSAIIVTLRQRGNIATDLEYQSLLDAIIIDGGNAKQIKRTPHLDTAVKKLCGKSTNGDIVQGIRTGDLSSIRAQYLIFGRVDKLKFEKYKASVGI